MNKSSSKHKTKSPIKNNNFNFKTNESPLKISSTQAAKEMADNETKFQASKFLSEVYALGLNIYETTVKQQAEVNQEASEIA